MHFGGYFGGPDHTGPGRRNLILEATYEPFFAY